ANPKEALAFLKEADKIFGFIFSKQKKESIPVQIKKLVETREKYRKQQNWRKSDQLRNRIKGEGWWVEDTVDGPKIKPL
ncbi:MAG: cysteine--tRNA ligase, partial [Candidatus Wildermuthbacteria bacterium]|nr:cysteine--tRNA ligase [Candidatus Wildermuthbacteria bacterium]